MKYIVHIDRKREAVRDNETEAVIYITRALDERFGKDKWGYKQMEDRQGQFVWSDGYPGKFVAAFIERISDEHFNNFKDVLMP